MNRKIKKDLNKKNMFYQQVTHLEFSRKLHGIQSRVKIDIVCVYL